MPIYQITPDCQLTSDSDPPISQEEAERALLRHLAEKYGWILIKDHRKECPVCRAEDE